MFSHYLMFGGDCAEALETYAAAFGARVEELQRYGDVPAPGFDVIEDQKNLVLHSRLTWDGTELMCSDSTDRRTPGSNMYVSVGADEAAIRHAWDVLVEGGLVYMALQPTFFAAAHGSLRDRFGINWMFTAMREG
ncbi:MAG: VOC family protein [Actinomycetia bacterium]|nr:VOC family protein [Actinomycetes bacterium]